MHDGAMLSHRSTVFEILAWNVGVYFTKIHPYTNNTFQQQETCDGVKTQNDAQWTRMDGLSTWCAPDRHTLPSSCRFRS